MAKPQYIQKKCMIKALKRNQIVIFAIALMLITAGYLNYSMHDEKTAETWSELEKEQMAGIGDARLVSNNNTYSENNVVSGVVENDDEFENGDNENNVVKQSSSTSNSTINSVENSTEKDKSTSQTSAKTSSDNEKYFSESKLERENMYSEMLETYQSMLANNSISSDQKLKAQTEISNINNQKNAIMIAENLIKNKGFEDLVIFANNGSVSVVVKAESLNEADIAQIQSIVQRELNVQVENIHISNK